MNFALQQRLTQPMMMMMKTVQSFLLQMQISEILFNVWHVSLWHKHIKVKTTIRRMQQDAPVWFY